MIQVIDKESFRMEYSTSSFHNFIIRIYSTK